MLRSSLLALTATLGMITGTVASATDLAEIQAEVSQAHVAHYLRYGVATPTHPARDIPGQNRWVATKVINIASVYSDEASQIWNWDRVAQDLGIPSADAAALLRTRLDAFRALDGRVLRGLARYDQETRAYAALMDRLRQMGGPYSDVCPAYYATLDEANAVLAQADRQMQSLLHDVRSADIFYLHTDANQRLLARLAALSPSGPIAPVDQAAALNALVIALTTAGLSPEDPIYRDLTLAAQQATADTDMQRAFAGLRHLDPAGQLPEAGLRNLQNELAARMAETLPVLAAGAAGAPAEPADLRRIVDAAQRLQQFAEDLSDPTANPSPRLRALTALRGTIDALNSADGGPDATTANSILNDLFSALSRGAPANLAYAAPQGGFVGSLQYTREGLDALTQSVDRLAAVIENSDDPRAMQALLDSVGDVRRALNPANFVRSMAEGFVGGWAQNVPFLRSFLDRLIAEMDGGWMPDGDVAQTPGHDPRCR